MRPRVLISVGRARQQIGTSWLVSPLAAHVVLLWSDDGEMNCVDRRSWSLRFTHTTFLVPDRPALSAPTKDALAITPQAPTANIFLS